MSDEAALHVNWLACKGYGSCAHAAPDLIELDDWGYPILPYGPIPRERRREAAKAIRDCPMDALRWATTGERVRR
jgi:ferredoxin